MREAGIIISNNTFSIVPTTGALTSAQELINNTLYNVVVKVTDLNGNGSPNELSDTATVTFQVGDPRVNKALCEGRQGALPETRCGDNLQVQFLDSSGKAGAQSTTVTGGNPSRTVTYPSTTPTDSPETIYNVLEKNPDTSTGIPPVTENHTTGALRQGALFIKSTLANSGTDTSLEDDFIDFTIQYKPIGSGSWSQANELIGVNQVPVYNERLQAGAGDTVFIEKVFNIPGEYRVLTTRISGGQCNLSPPNLATIFTVDFGDANYREDPCTDAPL